jgi:DNA invertase Pin-like site-specific DNA recombinase
MKNTKKAVIYTRGESETEQKLLCYFYASDNGIDVLFDTNNIEEVADCEECEIMLVAKPSRISRDAFEYHSTIKALRARGIEVVFTATEKSAERFIDFMMRDLVKNKG